MVKKARAPQFFTRILTPAEQATGTFDQGAIREQKMIGFAGEGSAIHRIGPLYYWAWAEASRPASVEPHPHRGFEIMTYVLEGTLEHRDSLGHVSRIDAGSLQLMQTGSGLEHEEHFIEIPAMSLQIWLDPHFRQETSVPPRYRVFEAQQFPCSGDARIILGADSPVNLVTPDVSMQDLALPQGAQHKSKVDAGMGWAGIMLKGSGILDIGSASYPIQARDFVVHQAEVEGPWMLRAVADLRMIWMRVPLVLPYPLFPKPR